MRWQFGAVLPPEIKTNLCEPEQEFYMKYNRMLVNYMSRNQFLDTEFTQLLAVFKDFVMLVDGLNIEIAYYY